MSRARAAVTAGLGSCVLAAAFAAPALYVPGLALVAIVVGSILCARVAAWAARIELEPLPASVEENEIVRVRARVRPRRAPLGAGRLRAVPGAPPQPLRALRGARAEAMLRARRRGRWRLGQAVADFGDPFGLCRRRVVSQGLELLVLPRLERVAPLALARLAGAGAAGAPATGAAGLDIDGLRPYRPGAPATRIHWPTVARTGALAERSFSDPGEGVPLVVLDASGATDGEGLDRAVRAAGSLALAFARAGGCSLLLPGSRRAHTLDPTLAGWPLLHAELALVPAGAEPWWAAVSGARLVVWVSAGISAAPPPPVRADVRVAPVALAGRGHLLGVCGCSAQALGRARAA